MSIKLYNGYRIVFPDGFDLFEWQEKLAELRDEFTADAQKRIRESFNTRAVYALDRDTMGLPRTHPDKSPLGAAYKAVEADCDALRRGERRPTFDTEVSLCWKAVSPTEVFITLYAEMREYRDRVIEFLGLEDYHYQNQVDPPDGCTWEEMEERGSRWEEAFGNWDNAPIARFHTFMLCDSPRYMPFLDVPDKPPYHDDIPMGDRVHNIAFDLLWAENEETASGQDTWAKIMWVRKQAKEGGELHDRLTEIKAEVATKLLKEPTWEDYRRKPPKVEEDEA